MLVEQKHPLEVTTTEIMVEVLLLFHKQLQAVAGALVKMLGLLLTLVVLVVALVLLTLVRTQLRGRALRDKELKVAALMDVMAPAVMMLAEVAAVLLAPE